MASPFHNSNSEFCRAFVIGNGPSLKDTPLDLLRGEVTYACGRINLIYPYTQWRPTYYVLAERLEQIDETATRHDLRQIIGQNETFSYIQSGVVGLAPSLHYLHAFTTCLCALKRNPPKTWHLPELCSFGSSLHVALQLASLHRYDPIYLVGCDLDGEHFAENYGPSAIQTDRWRQAHEIARKSSQSRIYNATIGGSLEVYERVDLCQLL